MGPYPILSGFGLQFVTLQIAFEQSESDSMHCGFWKEKVHNRRSSYLDDLKTTFFLLPSSSYMALAKLTYLLVRIHKNILNLQTLKKVYKFRISKSSRKKRKAIIHANLQLIMQSHMLIYQLTFQNWNYNIKVPMKYLFCNGHRRGLLMMAIWVGSKKDSDIASIGVGFSNWIKLCWALIGNKGSNRLI